MVYRTGKEWGSIRRMVWGALGIALLGAGCQRAPSLEAELTPAYMELATPAPTPEPALPSFVWDLATPAPAPAPTLPAGLLDEGTNAFTEIDIDESDGYRDFVWEAWHGDTYGTSTFFRLFGDQYVELGTLEGYTTQSMGNPSISLDGQGYLYLQETSLHLRWAKVQRLYAVEGEALVEVPPFQHVYYPIEAGEFQVVDAVRVLATGWPTETLQAMRPQDYPLFDWAGMGGPDYGREELLMEGDVVRIFGSDERGNVLLDYEGQAYLLPMMTQEMCELPQDQMREGRMFWECFYNEQAGAYYQQG